MVNRRRSTCLLVGVSALLALSGCKGATRICQVKDHPEKFDGKKIALEGTVSVVTSAEPGDVSKGGSFVIYDRTGNIRVITQQYLPNMYECVDVFGEVHVTESGGGTAPDVEIVGRYQPTSNSGSVASGPLPKEYGN